MKNKTVNFIERLPNYLCKIDFNNHFLWCLAIFFSIYLNCKCTTTIYLFVLILQVKKNTLMVFLIRRPRKILCKLDFFQKQSTKHTLTGR